MFSIFRKTRQLEQNIDAFLDLILKSALAFRVALKAYLSGDRTTFEEKVQEIDSLEAQADGLRREVENTIYAEMILPESRGDVLALLENSDDVLNQIADTIVEFRTENPAFPLDLHGHLLELVDASMEAVEQMVLAVQAYFRDLLAVRNLITKIIFYEKETDRLGERIKRSLFQRDDLTLAEKMHLRTFVQYLQQIADQAEDLGDRISIYVIKRMV